MIINEIVVRIATTPRRFLGSTNIRESLSNKRRLARGKSIIRWPAVVQNQTKAFLTMILKPGEEEFYAMNLIYLSAIDNIYNLKQLRFYKQVYKL